MGTRPEMIRLSQIIKKLDVYTNHTLVHTGQNYDDELSTIFYDDLGIRKPDYHLNATTIGDIITQTTKVLSKVKPDAVVILGDTNSSLSGIVAKRMKIPLFHLEAGNRCFDDNVPEEINRRILDHIADINMVYTENSRRNLLNEGLKADRIYLMGSPIGEIVLNQLEQVKGCKIVEDMGLTMNGYYVVSIHREENVENKKNLDEIVKAINKMATSHNVVLTCHPRLAKKGIKFHKNVQVCKPFNYTNYLGIQVQAKCVVSDSGTVSEESAILGFPAVTVRDAMERPEAIDAGTIVKVPPIAKNILEGLKIAKRPTILPAGYEIANTSERVLRVVMGQTEYINKYIWRK